MIEGISIKGMSNDLEKLKLVLARNYTVLLKLYRGIADSSVTDENSSTIDDIYHDSILDLLTKSDKFIYENESKTLSYIKRFLFLNKKEQLRKGYKVKGTLVELDIEDANDL